MRKRRRYSVARPASNEVWQFILRSGPIAQPLTSRLLIAMKQVTTEVAGLANTLVQNCTFRNQNRLLSQGREECCLDHGELAPLFASYHELS